MNLIRFKKGDYIKCIRPAIGFGLRKGHIYIVTDISHSQGTYSVKMLNGEILEESWFDDSRFKLHKLAIRTQLPEDLFTI